MVKPMLSPEAVREALESIPEEIAHHGTEPPEVGQMYVVPSHEKALNPETPLVVGDRGVGKSFWSAALNGDATRTAIAKQLSRLNLESVQVSLGFSSGEGKTDHPSRRVLSKLRELDFTAENIWRAVILEQLATRSGQPLPGKDWEGHVRFVTTNPESEERLLNDIDSKLFKENRQHLIVFDALDRLGDNWQSIRELLKGLLRVCLDMRSYRAIRTKLFMRPDMFEDPLIWSFPDASKLHHGLVTLAWRRVDLYGLLWHWLANNQASGGAFRGWTEREYRLSFEQLEVKGQTVYAIPGMLRTNEDIQTSLLNAIASTYMGRNPRRGRTYTWLPTHLADAKGQVSPRSFLLAIKRAQAQSRERGAEEIIHYDGIKQGVQHASQIRRREMLEDYWWVEEVLKPLQGVVVPCTVDEMKDRWRNANVVEAVENPRDQGSDVKAYLPPHALEDLASGEDPEDAIIEALVGIGVMNRLADGRLNIPDLFRVAAGIGRKGGVKAIR